MKQILSTLKSILVAANPRVKSAMPEAEEMAAHLKSHGLRVHHGPMESVPMLEQITREGYDLLVAVGGDGTMLRAAHLCAPYGIPILGVNLGRLGFLIQIPREEWRDAFEKLLQGEYWIENRMMILVEHRRGKKTLGSWHALNEAVVCRGQPVRSVHVSASVDGRLLTNYVADGLIAATPTGSTAYALAAGGPILPPELRNILLVPIAPHLSVDRAVVLSEGSSVRITLTGADHAVLSVDGQNPMELAEHDSVDIRAGDYAARFIRYGDPGYFYRNLTEHMNQNTLASDPR